MLHNEIRLGTKIIGDDYPCFIIAEAGVNHDGNINKAKELIDIAKDCGADAVKFQTWITEEIATETVSQAEYQKTNIGKRETQFDMLKRLELSFNEFEELKKYADQKKIIFLSTPDDEKSVDFLDSIGIPAFKIGSGELTNIFMLEKVAKKNKPIILSTGMAILEEVGEALDIIHNAGNKKLILLHCTSQYPTKLKDVNLKAMNTLQNNFNTIVGYSDHTIGILVPQIAVALGANVVEKHFTYDKNAKGPDHICSLEPLELKEMIKEIRTVELILGSEIKKPTLNEIKLKKIVRKTVVANQNILRGTIISKEMLSVKRAEGFLEPKDIYELIGKITLKDIKKDQVIIRNDLS